MTADMNNPGIAVKRESHLFFAVIYKKPVATHKEMEAKT